MEPADERELLASFDESAWAAFMAREARTVYRIAGRRCGAGAGALQSALDDIGSEAVLKLISALTEERVRSSPGRYFAGIVDKMIRRVLEKRGRVEDLHSSQLGGEAPPSRPMRTDELEKSTRKMVRTGFETLRSEIAAESSKPRDSRRQAPLLHVLVLDLVLAGKSDGATLKAALGIDDPSDVSRLKAAALDRFRRHLDLAQLPELVDADREVPSGLAEAMGELWTTGRQACGVGRLAAPGDPSHASDRSLQREGHLNIVRCPLCRPVEVTEEEVIRRLGSSLLRTASRSFPLSN